jgi:hypothetical protein
VTPKDGTYTNGTNWDVLVSTDGFQNETDIPKAKQPGYQTSLVEMKKKLRVTG